MKYFKVLLFCWVIVYSVVAFVDGNPLWVAKMYNGVDDVRNRADFVIIAFISTPLVASIIHKANLLSDWSWFK